MLDSDVLFGFRLRLFDHAREVGVSQACRTFGVHRSTYYRWKSMVERSGLEMLRPRERRAPRMPNALSPVIEQRILAFSIAHPGLGPRRISASLAQERWGGIVVSHSGVWKVLRRHGLSRRISRLSLVAGYAAPAGPEGRAPEPERHIEVDHPGELVGLDCFHVGRLSGTSGRVWQYTAIDLASFGWRLERVLTDNGSEFRSSEFGDTIRDLGAVQTRIHPGRPTSNGSVERVQRTILEECWRPSFARSLVPKLGGIERDLTSYLAFYNTERAHTGRYPQGRTPWQTLIGARKMRPR